MPILDEYEKEINYYPPELQTSTAVLFAIVRCVSSDGTPMIVMNTEACDRQNLNCHHYIMGAKMMQLPLVGSDATFSSLLQLANELVVVEDHALVVEFCDRISIKIAEIKDQSSISNGNQ